MDFLYFSLFDTFEDVSAKGAALFGNQILECLGDTFSEEGLKLLDNQGTGVRSDLGLSKPIPSKWGQTLADQRNPMKKESETGAIFARVRSRISESWSFVWPS